MNQRIAEYPILDCILNRWSPRAMSGQALTISDLMTVFEAGRWAPSSYNNQPWHFIYGLKGTSAWNSLFNLLVPSNQSWCVNSGALVCVLSAKNFFMTGKPSRTHILDTGAAWENIAIQAHNLNFVVHGMEGFSYEKAKEVLQVPDAYEVVMIFALGYPAPKETLSPDLQKKEFPSDRVPLKELVSEGIFKNTRIIKQ